MNININPVTVVTDAGPVLCTSANVSVAVSSSTAIRLVPVGPNGVEFPDAAMGIVGGETEADVAVFMVSVAAAVSTLAQGRGI